MGQRLNARMHVVHVVSIGDYPIDSDTAEYLGSLTRPFEWTL
jgi:hypothetical protein